MSTEILHVTRRSDWESAEALGIYDISTRGRTIEEVGFIHCSLGNQLADVAELVFGDCREDLVVLVMEADALAGAAVPVLFEDGGDGQLYPHLYGPVPTRLVVEIRRAGFDQDGAFYVEDPRRQT